MGYYDVTNDIPIELTIEGHKKKNNELAINKKIYSIQYHTF